MAVASRLRRLSNGVSVVGVLVPEVVAGVPVGGRRLESIPVLVRFNAGPEFESVSYNMNVCVSSNCWFCRGQGKTYGIVVVVDLDGN